MLRILLTTETFTICEITERITVKNRPRYRTYYPGYYLRLSTKHKWYEILEGSATLKAVTAPMTLENLYQEARYV